MTMTRQFAQRVESALCDEFLIQRRTTNKGEQRAAQGVDAIPDRGDIAAIVERELEGELARRIGERLIKRCLGTGEAATDLLKDFAARFAPHVAAVRCALNAAYGNDDDVRLAANCELRKTLLSLAGLTEDEEWP